VTVYGHFTPVKFCGENLIHVSMLKGDQVVSNTALSQELLLLARIM